MSHGRIIIDEYQHADVLQLADKVGLRLETATDLVTVEFSPKETADLCRLLIESAWDIIKDQLEPLMVLVKAMEVDK